MIVHHQGALEMAQLADGRAEDPRVLDLAGRIEAAQDPEIETMTGWLEDWGQPTSPQQSGGMGGEDMGGEDMGGEDMGGEDMGGEDMGGMDMGGMDMGGLDMGGLDISGLEAASGAPFDRMWLEMMSEHHRGAVDMSETEIADGRNADAIGLAEQIVESQTAEIEGMETLLTESGR